MTGLTRDQLVEIITQEVMRSLAAESAPGGDGAPVMPSRLGPEPFILAPESFSFAGQPVDGKFAIEQGYVRIGVSARHCHVTQEHLEVLFGGGSKLTVYRDLLQPGEFAAEQSVTIVGPRMRALEKVRILGPTRKKTQVEVSLTDAVYLGFRPPVRPSGNHEGSVAAVIVGPKGSIQLKDGVIRANRHIHLHARDAQVLGLKDNMKLMVHIDGDRPVLYQDVQLRVSEKFVSEMHLDTDDANAVGVESGDFARILTGVHECRIRENL